MRSFLLAATLSLLTASPLLAQTPAPAPRYPACETTVFVGTQLPASTICFDADHRWGQARAYDRTGRVLYEQPVRRVAGTARVEFSYYPDGAVRRAEYSDQPDGGIQRYHTVTTFTPTGQVESVLDDSTDNQGRPHLAVPHLGTQ